MPRIVAAVTCLINEQRRAAGLAPLVASRALRDSAAEHSQDMVARGYFGHFDPFGTSPERRMLAAGYGCGSSCTVGENIAWGVGAFSTPAAIVGEWMRSASHRANILDPTYQREGLGVASGVPRSVWGRPGGDTITQDFGTSG